MSANEARPICLFLCGDVMTGRGIDQVLPYPAPPDLYEPYIRDAREYVRLAEKLNGAISRPVDFAYTWGDAMEELQRAKADARIINLETSITCNDAPWPDKGINYRMNPRNVDCITAAGINCCCLANNHVLDWGYRGLAETIDTLDAAGVLHTGAGQNAKQASAPTVLDLSTKGRLLVFAFGAPSSGIPSEWSATSSRPGINFIEDVSEDAARSAAATICSHKRSGDVVVASIHWGSNWGYDIPSAHIDFAHGLIESGVDVVHGHSSHHVQAAEVYRDRLILYGCGDFITDYEGIGGYEEFRNDLVLMYLVKVDAQGQLTQVRMVPMQLRRFRLSRVSEADAAWLCDLLNEVGRPFATEVQLESDRSMTLRR